MLKYNLVNYVNTLQLLVLSYIRFNIFIILKNSTVLISSGCRLVPIGNKVAYIELLSLFFLLPAFPKMGKSRQGICLAHWWVTFCHQISVGLFTLLHQFNNLNYFPWEIREWTDILWSSIWCNLIDNTLRRPHNTS